jgi:hypothetical protein
MTLEQIREKGLRSLAQELGAVGLVWFLQQFEIGSGDYTLERHRWLAEPSVQDVVQEIEHPREKDDSTT